MEKGLHCDSEATRKPNVQVPSRLLLSSPRIGYVIRRALAQPRPFPFGPSPSPGECDASTPNVLP
jgi:hypothetical protein